MRGTYPAMDRVHHPNARFSFHMLGEEENPMNIPVQLNNYPKTCYRNIVRSTLIMILMLVIWMALPTTDSLKSAEPERVSRMQEQNSPNMLLNPSFEGSFYWEYPNHYVAENWNRWWIHGSSLPEYTDSSAHSIRPHFDGERAQVWHIWGRTYTAGIYQVVHNVTPCTLYELSTWVRNHSLSDAQPHARIGLDLQGTQLTPSRSSGAIVALPPNVKWSREQTSLYVWENLSMTSEAINEELTAIFYTSPQRGSQNSTYFFDSIWDAASLVPKEFPSGRLPTPEASSDPNFIYNVTAESQLNSLVIEWDTLTPASTQVIYEVSTTEVLTSEVPYSYTVYMPILSKAPSTPSAYTNQTVVDTEPVLHHKAIIPNLPDESKITITFIPLSRYPTGSSCTTEMTDPVKITIETPKIFEVYLPMTKAPEDLEDIRSYGR